MMIPLALDAGEGGGSLCLEAEVLQGDVRIDDKRVTVSLEPGTSPGSSRVHVRSTVVIDEPVVTVTLRAGCDTKSTRRFVLFADVPVEAAAVATAPAAAARVVEGAAPTTAAPFLSGRSADATPAREAPGSSDIEFIPQPPPRRAPTAAPRVSRAPGSEAPSRPAAAIPPPPPPPRARVAASAPVVRPPVSAPTPRVAATAPAPVPAPRSEASGGGSRLRIEALEPAPTRQGEPQSSPVLAPPATEDPGKRAEAAAASRPPAPTALEELQRDARRLEALDASLNVLREQTIQNQRTLMALRFELADARESRYRNPLVYALIGLLLLALLAMALLWRALRRASAPAWWREESRQGQARRLPTGPQDDDFDPGRPAGPRRVAPGSTFAPLQHEEEDEEGFELPPAVPAPPMRAHPAQRLVNTEELFDVQQQSDFFVSLGQHDQAIAVLRDHIAGSPDTSALAYLDLLKIYHSLGREEEYDRVRQSFLSNFNAGVPEFEHFDQAGRGLEHYPAALARIEARWPASGTLPLIEELVFRKPGKGEEDSFDLAAYRELLLLYSVAKEVIDPGNAPPAPVTPLSFADTRVHAELFTAPAPLLASRAPFAPEIDTDSATEAARLEPTTEPAALDDAGPPTQPGPLFDAVEKGLHDDTVMAPDAPLAGRGEPPPARPGRALDFTEVDRTAYETLPSPLEESAAAPAPQADPHTIDFELFDPATEAKIAPHKLPDKG